uniref:Homeodomain-only protein n=1 Tax=Panthera leo TaxID=9689 RepID=A0A8C8WP36_PANLE
MSAETASGPTEDQVEILEYNFNKVNKHPDPTTLCLIAAEAGLSEEETQVISRNRKWHLESNLQREVSPRGSLLPLVLDYFSLLPPHSKKMV